jgi:hypothetical protein
VPRLAGLVIALLAGLVLAGCGSEDSTARKLRQETVTDTAALLRKNLVTEDDIRREEAGSPRQALLRFWSTLQYKAWWDATGFYEPGLRDAVGAPTIADGLKYQEAFWRGTRPDIRTVRADGRDRQTVEFLADAGGSRPEAFSVTWERAGGRWLIAYDSMLDRAVRSAVQEAAQMRIDPLATRPAPEAVREGIAAAQRQSDYLARREQAQRSSP